MSVYSMHNSYAMTELIRILARKRLSHVVRVLLKLVAVEF